MKKRNDNPESLIVYATMIGVDISGRQAVLYNNKFVPSNKNPDDPRKQPPSAESRPDCS